VWLEVAVAPRCRSALGFGLLDAVAALLLALDGVAVAAGSLDFCCVEYGFAWSALGGQTDHVVHFVYALSASLVLQLAHTIASAYLILDALRDA